VPAALQRVLANDLVVRGSTSAAAARERRARR
jgi:hypothetical protein